MKKPPAPGKGAAPAVGDERVLFHTNRGDLVFGLYDAVAPKHAAQIRKLVRAGRLRHAPPSSASNRASSPR